MIKRDTIIAEYLPSMRTSDLQDWDTISNYRVPGKNQSLIPYQLRYELTRSSLFLTFEYQGNSKEQIIDIIIEPSNLGVGEVWFMCCPQSGRKCRKLVLWKGEFVHQSTIKCIHYKQQTESSPERSSKKWIRRYTEYQKILSQQLTPYYKSMYAGRYTKLAVQATRALLLYADALQNEKEIWAWYGQKPNHQK